MVVKIVVPDLGGSAALPPIVLSTWFAEVGDLVFEGDRLVELLTAGATFDVAAPVTGRLVAIDAYTDDRLQAGQRLGVIEVASEPGLTDPSSE